LSNSTTIPARREDLVTQELPAEVLLYDPATHQAHCLNRSAAAVWRACDGARGLGEVGAAAAAEMGTPLDAAAVELALRQLSDAGLLAGRLPSTGERLSRRELTRRVAMAALIPAVLSLTAPPAHAASSNCRSRGQSCTGSGQSTCCPGLTCLSNLCV
jgi:hypothetical protein